MHFSIPDLQQFRDDNGITYTGYNIHIDGVFHCTARYKQLLSLHEQLQAHHSHYKLPQFPPKKLFLTNSQLEERRILLEKYIQLIGQNPMLANSDILITFLFSAQQETHSVKVHEVDIEISLMNGYRIPLSVSSTDCSSAVLDIACNYINLSKDLTKYFSLYLFNWSCAKDGQPSLKKLEEYESPYISQKYVRPEDKIVLRKSYWDPCYDHELMTDRVSLDLLYLQVIEDIDLGWIAADPQTKDVLSTYEAKKQKREYIELARTLRHYGRIPAGEAVTDACNVTGELDGSCRVRVSLASKELTLISTTHPSREQRYKVTRMRCWRITTLHNVDKSLINGHGQQSLLEECNKNFELSFEYLLSKDNLTWITLKTENAIFISVCLQMAQKQTDSERIRQLLEDVSTPESTPERDPYSDDGEYGSDREFQPNYDDMSSSDVESTKTRKLARNMMRTEFSGSSDTLVSDDEVESIVEELMRQKSGAGPASARGRRGALTFLRRDGSSRLVTPSSSSDTLSSLNGDSYNSGSSREIFSVQKLTEKFASVAFKSGKDCVENNAFEAIGDEEL